MENTITTAYGSDEIYTVSIAVVSSGDSNTAQPTLTAPPYVGCPDTWQQCGDEPWYAFSVVWSGWYLVLSFFQVLSHDCDYLHHRAKFA